MVVGTRSVTGWISTSVFNWNDIRILLEVVRRGSIIRAAASLQIDGSTVSRRIQALERELGTKCFKRESGRLVLTPECAPILDQARRMEDAASAIERATLPDTTPAAGRVSVATTRTMAAKIVLPAARELARQSPHITVEVDSQVQRIDLIAGEADIALTAYPVEHPRLIKRLAFSAACAFYGSRDYLGDRPLPTSDTLAGHKLLGLAAVNAKTRAGAWWKENIRGGDIVLRSSSAEELLQLCGDGHGLALLFCFRADAHGLVRIPDIATFSLPHWLVLHPDVQRMARVRTVKDLLDARIAEARDELERFLPSRRLACVDAASDGFGELAQ